MIKSKEVLHQALQALEYYRKNENHEPTPASLTIGWLRQALAEWTPDDTAYRPDGLSQEELPPVKSYCGGKPNYCEPEMDKQCSSCGGFCGDVCERENVKPDPLNQTCCGCGRSGGYALYCGWCWDKADKENK